MGCRWLTEKLKTLWAKLKERLKKISKKVYIIAGAALVVLAAAVVLVLYNRPYAVLVTGVSSGEASSIWTVWVSQIIRWKTMTRFWYPKDRRRR